MKLLYERLRTTRGLLGAWLLGLLLLAASVVQGQTVIPDKLDYAPGSTAIISGTGFGVVVDGVVVEEEVVQIHIDHIYLDGPSHVDEDYTVTTKDGAFVFNYEIGWDEADELFYLSATGLTSGSIAKCEFTDGPPPRFDFILRIITNFGATPNVASAASATVIVSGTMFNGNPLGGTTVTTQGAGGGSGTDQVQLNSSYTFSFPTSVVGVTAPYTGVIFNFVSVDATSPQTAGAVDGGSKIITATYSSSCTQPSITCPTILPVNNDPGVCTASIPFAATVGGTPTPTVTYAIGTTPITSPYNFPVGTTTVTATATNTCSTASCTFTVTVNDTEKPSITCAAPVTVSNDLGACNATVILTAPTVNDNCSVSSTVNDHSLTTFPVGTTVVLWTVTDIHGNTNTCTQSVTVNDTEKPTISCAAPVVVENATGSCSATVTLSAPTVNDNCAVSSTINDHPSTTYPVGITAVLWTVTDIHGNTNTCIQTVTVNDTEKPTISCPKTFTSATDAGECYATISEDEIGDPLTGDNCGVSSTISDFTSLFPDDQVPFGVHTITWTVEDIHGNKNSCTQIVDVNEVTTLTSVSVSPSTQQYSDKVLFTATVTPFECYEAGTAATCVTFFVGTQEMGTVALVGGVATATYALLEPSPFGTDPTGNMKPGNHTVKAVFCGINPDFVVPDATTTLTITCEDADVTYTGSNYFTTNPSGFGTVFMSAYVIDDNDGYPGDIQNATVSFREGTVTGTVLGEGDIPVGLVSSTLTTEGFAADEFQDQLSSSEMSGGGKTWDVWTTVNNYYCGETAQPEVLTLAMPGTDFVTGGGYIILTSTASGTYPGKVGSKMNFGFVMKWNKSGKNLQGRVNIIYRGPDGYNYQIKSNAINSLSVSVDGDYKKAVIITKANLKRIFPDGSSNDLGGNLTLTLNAWENTTVKTGKLDMISIQLAGGNGSGIYFTNKFSGGKTQMQLLDGGKIQVRSQYIGDPGTKSAIVDVSGQVSVSDLKIYPNPFSDKLRFEFIAPADMHARINLYDVTGRMVQTVFDSEVKGGVDYNADFKPATDVSGMYFYRATLGDQVFNGKVMYKK